jgi:hypothetical protein
MVATQQLPRFEHVESDAGIMSENAQVKAERLRQQREWEAGVDEGYEATGPLPNWMFTLAPAMLTARQQGYWFGRQLRQHEKDE